MSTAAGPDGLLVVDKPGGMTSHGVVARVRRAAGTRKVGHAGTLDPMATGVLLLGLGRATRLLGHLMLTDKTYAATIRLGAATTTDDAEGEVSSTTSAAGVTEADVRVALAGMVGQIDQVPSAVSAIKVDGQRAYARVRAGEDVVLAPRRVTIHDLHVGDLRRPDEALLDVEVIVRCSSGTYVRAIARDLGRTLGVGGHLTALRRQSVGPFDVSRAVALESLDERVELISMEDAARACFPTLTLSDDQADRVRVGQKLPIDGPGAVPIGDLTALFDPEGEFLALYQPEGVAARAVAVFVG